MCDTNHTGGGKRIYIKQWHVLTEREQMVEGVQNGPILGTFKNHNALLDPIIIAHVITRQHILQYHCYERFDAEQEGCLQRKCDNPICPGLSIWKTS